MKAIIVSEPGGPEQLQYGDEEKPSAGSGQVLVKIGAAGVNYIDVYHRTGLYKMPLPLTPGLEGAGAVEQVGEGVTDVKVGDRVTWAGTPGSYAEYAAVPAASVVSIPAGLTDEQAAAAMLQGMTAHYLVHSTWPLKAGETCLVHAAAGGVGLILCQMAKTIGARVIGTAGSGDKAAKAKGAGADEVILYAEQDFEAEVKRITGGKGVDVVYDSVGASTFEKSMNCLRPRGMMVTFGNASGPVPPVAPLLLSQRGSVYLTRPTLAHYTATREELLWRAGDVLGAIASGKLKLTVDHRYKLADAAQAHRDLETRKTTGKLILLP